MNISIENVVSNSLVLDQNGIYIKEGASKFNYSDGIKSEQYLNSVLINANDLSTNSYELESHIVDWNSEYHLSRKRSQLLKGIKFDKTKKVLEVGAGCGAITRFLGEEFHSVVAIEGSYERAKIAKLRTNDLNNVTLICSPFQEIEFIEKFDIIFCIGVFEYSSIFVNSVNPYEYILDYFSSLLTPNGEVVIAIENQFGLRYFSSSAEDHNNVMFDGIEGYPRYRNLNAKTFGYTFIKEMLKKNFPNISFYFPFPDYKTPSLLLSENFFNNFNAAELIGNFKPTGYLKWPKKLFDENLCLIELQKNGALNFFANSFLIIAKKDFSEISTMDTDGILFSSLRKKDFQTVTKFYQNGTGELIAEKKLVNHESSFTKDKLTINNCISQWIDSLSVHLELMRLAKFTKFNPLLDFEIVNKYLDFLISNGNVVNGELYVSGEFVDFNWKNCFVQGQDVYFIDREWEWEKPIKLKYLVIKSIYDFINEVSQLNNCNAIFIKKSKARRIKNISNFIGINITNNEISEFIKFQSEISKIVYGKNKNMVGIDMFFDLYFTLIYNKLLGVFNFAKKGLRKFL